MMNFNEFTEKLMEDLKKNEAMETKITRIKKSNYDGTYFLTGLILANKSVSPTVYLEDLYTDYTEGRYEDVYQNVVKIFTKENPSFSITRETILKNVIPVFVPGTNVELTSNSPYKKFNDLLIIYNVFIENEETGIGTIRVTYDILENFKINETELISTAMENLSKVTTVTPMSKIFNEFCDIDPSDDMYVVSNIYKIKGASSILEKNVLRNICDIVDEDKLYIIPSSIHECIVIRANTAPVNEILQMIQEVNDSEVSIEEKLSYHAYEYNNATGDITEI